MKTRTTYYTECSCGLHAGAKYRFQAEFDAQQHAKASSHSPKVVRYVDGRPYPILAQRGEKHD